MYSLGIIYILDLVVSYQSVSGVFARMPPCVPFGNWLGETTISNTVSLPVGTNPRNPFPSYWCAVQSMVQQWVHVCVCVSDCVLLQR